MSARSRTKTRTGAQRARSQRTRKRRGDVIFSMIAVTVVFGSLLGIVVLQTFIVQTRVNLDAVNSDLAEARERNQQLRLEVIELEAPERILDTAVTRLGMVRPDERTYLPGIDPNLVEVRLPPSGDPFGPAPLPDHLRTGDS
jgi:cell division protein FtsL